MLGQGMGDMNEEGAASMQQQQEARRKRGRPPKRDPKGDPKEEDVCFHCHDGGQLILCDRRPCPKVYHLHCTGRDAEFFQTTASWFCSWHYCSLCMKSSVILCYTCTNSYCKNCIKAVSFIPLRKTRGFCETCFELVKMIENGETVNSEGIIVDFNDRETYEFLYKDYWEDTKKDLSLTWEEIYRSMKANEACKKSVINNSGNRNWGLKNCDANDKERDAKRTSKWLKHRPSEYLTPEDDSESDYSTERESDGKRIRSRRRKVKAYRSSGWASTELLDFVQFMGKNSREPLATKVVSELLWTYIENNKLQDPEKRGQIVCDERLKRLFGRQSVGQFEIRKLLKHHFASKHENVRKFSNNMAGLEADFVEVSSSDNESFKGKSKSRRKLEKHKSRKVYSNNYAAINVSNINLIYIKRSLLEVLLHDPALSSKIIGSFVRIRSPGMAGTNDKGYDIVQVTGIKHQPDCVNAKHGCFTLKVLTAQKQEQATIEVAADVISDRDFTEEECERLRQSMKLGIRPVMMVADLEEKANALHEVKVTDFIKTESVKLCNLRDRANEKDFWNLDCGCCETVMEYVEKLRLLRSSDERKRRLMEPITIMSDSDMDPTTDISSQRHTSDNQAPVADTHMDIACIDSKTPVNDSEGGLQVLDDENMKIWLYQDPKSRTQGPFSMKQLRKWAKANLFPPDLRIWRAESQDEVILLSNALEKKIKESNPSDAINILQ